MALECGLSFFIRTTYTVLGHCISCGTERMKRRLSCFSHRAVASLTSCAIFLLHLSFSSTSLERRGLDSPTIMAEYDAFCTYNCIAVQCKWLHQHLFTHLALNVDAIKQGIWCDTWLSPWFLWVTSFTCTGTML
ncbi:hypothetical protein EMCRGX_G024805 [Ephydatia muelleri]